MRRHYDQFVLTEETNDFFPNDAHTDTMTIKAIIFDVDGTLADTSVHAD
jgi:hypothetical protein